MGESGLLLGFGQLGEDASLTFLTQPITLAADVDGRREMQESIQDGRCQDLIGEDIAPLAIGLVAGQDDRAPAITATDGLKQELSGVNGRAESSPFRPG